MPFRLCRVGGSVEVRLCLIGDASGAVEGPIHYTFHTVLDSDRERDSQHHHINCSLGTADGADVKQCSAVILMSVSLSKGMFALLLSDDGVCRTSKACSGKRGL